MSKTLIGLFTWLLSVKWLSRAEPLPSPALLYARNPLQSSLIACSPFVPWNRGHFVLLGSGYAENTAFQSLRALPEPTVA